MVLVSKCPGFAEQNNTYEARCHFIHQADLGSSNKHARELELPLLSATQRRGLAVRLHRQVAAGNQFMQRLRVFIPALDLAPELDMLKNRELAKEDISLGAEA